MDEQLYDTLSEMATMLDEMGTRLGGVAEALDELLDENPGDERESGGVALAGADARWLRGAKRELSDLIRAVEGPNPPPAR